MKAISLLFLLIACATPPKETPEEAMAKPMVGKHPGIRNCYTKTTHYVNDPDSGVTVKVEFDVAKNGDTSNHKVLSSTLADEKFKKCVVESLSTLKYPPNGEDFIIEQTFTLAPKVKK